ncbi:F-box family protein [Striga asiatica]|uniref:F-box family protein n=1 Tax=Striga asiatica TaxID=4170 RepID=A0A5A7R9D8_STRAF|nr:F-box family protein [Striga asiatica]
MKTTAGSGAFRSLTPSAPSFYTYLKPGALAQLRYSKTTARSKEIGAQTLLALLQLELSSNSAFPQPHSDGLAMDGIPCFDVRVKSYPRCLQRKKLVALTPFFSETQT